MGQCAPSSPINYSPTLVDDDEMLFVTAPPDTVGCRIGFPSNTMVVQNGAGRNSRKRVANEKPCHEHNSKSDNTQQKKFLQAHEPDIPQRCIIDQSEIKKAIWLQSDEILRRKGLLKMQGTIMDETRGQIRSANENQLDEDRKSIFSEPSTTSGITSASNTTVVRANMKRKAINKENKAEATNGPVSSLARVNHTEKEDNTSDTHDFTRRFESSGNETVDQKVLNHTRNSRGRQCMSVLRLKIRANIGWFYTQRYLTMFPNERKVIGAIPTKENHIPGLESESSDSSFSSRDSSCVQNYCADYGSMPPTTPVKCAVTNDSFLDLAVMGCLGIVPRKQDHNALRSSRRQLRDHCKKGLDHCVVLINRRSGIPIAVCTLKAKSGSPVVRIYATRQMTFAQRCAATTRQLGLDWADDLPLYAWAEVKSQGDFPGKMEFYVHMVKRFDGSFSLEPSYKACFDGHYNGGDTRTPIIKMVGRTYSERSMSGCALISIQTDDTMGRTQTDSPSDLCFHIHLSQGIDPAFLICFTSIVDEILEKSMRTRCQNQTRGLVRKDSFSLTKERLETRSRGNFHKMMADIPVPCRHAIA